MAPVAARTRSGVFGRDIDEVGKGRGAREPMRFSIVQVKDGPWVVVDGDDHRRRIASCAEAERRG